ncbi:DUF3267 domain-containing protein [Listeria monocytogenes]|uniref:DUF3267 domain-containing protein n=1 Tax=Listeria monocytogenes TaxID=1639 RepID=UPI001796138D|nr:DUF3267 domain-containing protein [Listeria monocytogenes]EAH3161895.1 DUF3267 domain-containing protein [Listeria monocytogenes]MCI2515965.1 DUF3267 domain-containing protein [Listeria monocytogenes]
MRCLKSINTERRDEFNRLFLKGILVWLAAVCICFLTQHLIYPDQLTNDYQLASFLGIILIYPIHKLLHILGCFKYREGTVIQWRIHFFFLHCIKLNIKRIIPKWHYIFSLILPFVIITTILVALMLFTPIGHSGMFLLLLSVHFGMSFSDFTHIKKLWKMPKNCFIESAERGFSVLISD